jgi:hypothetical protein
MKMQQEKDFVIDQISWHSDREGNPESREHIYQRFKTITQFLQKNNLAKRVLLRDDSQMDDSFCIRASDLTDEGLTVMKKGYDKWLRRLDKGQDPADTVILEKILRDLRS